MKVFILYVIIVYLVLSGELLDPLIPLNSILFHIFVGNLGVGVLHELHVFVGGLWVGIDLELFGLNDDLDVETGQEFLGVIFGDGASLQFHGVMPGPGGRQVDVA